MYPPWPKEWHCTGETSSSCWFYRRAMMWQSSHKWIGSTVRPRHWAKRCCWHPSSCLLFYTRSMSHQHQGLLVPRLLVPPICLSLLRRRDVKNCAWTHQHSLSFLKRELNSLARNNEGRWMPIPQMGWE